MTLIVESHTAPNRQTATDPAARSRPRRVDAPAHMLLFGALWLVYAMVRNLTSDTQQAAIGNATRLLHVESTLGIDIEGAVQSAIGWPHAMVAANAYYLLHFPLTLTVMALAYWRRRATVFSALRNSLIGCTASALVIHLAVPLAPPRMLPGFIDAGATFGPDPYAIAGSESANQFAAMPSMHVAWAILVGYAVWHLSARRIGRFVGIVHPIVTSLVVVVTGHHFVSDVVIGAGLAVLFLVAHTCLSTQRRRVGSPCSPSFGESDAREHTTIGGVATTRLPDDGNPSKPHTDIDTSASRTHEERDAMNPLHPEQLLTVHGHRQRRLEEAAAIHRACGGTRPRARILPRRHLADHR